METNNHKLNLILEFPEQLLEAIEISKENYIRLNKEPQNVVLYGLGELAIAPEILKEWLHLGSFVPINVCSDYHLPEFTNEDTLVIICSYTESDQKALVALDQALSSGAMVIGISSQGKLLDVLNEKNLYAIAIPNDFPVRYTLAYHLVQLASIVDNLKLSPSPLIPKIEESIPFIKNNQDFIASKAAHLLQVIGDKQIFFSSQAQFLRPVSMRAAFQINENSIDLESPKVIPYVNYKVMIGLHGISDNLLGIFLCSENSFGRNKEFSEFNRNYMPYKINQGTQILADGANLLQETLYLIHMIDWLSQFLSENKTKIQQEDIGITKTPKRNIILTKK